MYQKAGYKVTKNTCSCVPDLSTSSATLEIDFNIIRVEQIILCLHLFSILPAVVQRVTDKNVHLLTRFVPAVKFLLLRYNSKVYVINNIHRSYPSGKSSYCSGPSSLKVENEAGSASFKIRSYFLSLVLAEALFSSMDLAAIFISVVCTCILSPLISRPILTQSGAVSSS